jgi:hypothetical protein
MCGQPIQGPYYRVGPQEVCTPCRGRAVGQPSSPGALDATFARSIVTGMVGSGIYFAALWIFHWYGAMLSMLVGAAAGAGVNAGAGGRGTLRHRMVAALLTYGALAVVHAPIVMRDFAAVNRTDFGYAAPTARSRGRTTHDREKGRHRD